MAGNIAQFVDYGTKLLSSGIELYKSTTGALQVNVELELVAAEIAALMSKLSLELELGTNFQDMCHEATNIANELLARIEKQKIAGRNRAWKSLRQAISSAWTKEEVATLVARMEKLQGTIVTSVLISMREKVDVMSIRMSERFDSLDQQTKRIVLVLLEKQARDGQEKSQELQDMTLALTQILSRMEFSIVDENRKTREQLRKSAGIVRTAKIVDVSEEEEDNLRFAVETRILESLKFKTMMTRQDGVAEAHKKTFEWIFQAPRPGNKSHSNFIQWLSAGDGVYWIRGKAGSGKSTLMRYISLDCRTERYLREWAGDLPLYSAHHYFWNSGTGDQRSQHGLLQTVLYEVLNKQPKLIPIVLPWYWAKTYSIAAAMQLSTVEFGWSLAKLMEAFTMLVQQSMLPVKLCLFIDGLDEFEGDHEQISELFKEVSTSSNVKVCLSGRPWRVFEICFSRRPSLKLQDLTYSDIKSYVIDKLHKNDAFKQLEKREPLAAPALITEITERADGVFLWVQIVVKSLLQGLRNLDGIDDLLRRLRLLPRDLADLYGFMFGLIEVVYHRKSSEIFQIFRAARVYKDHLHAQKLQNEPLSILALHFAVNPETPLSVMKSYKASDLESLREQMEVHLTVHCAGLLESWKDSKSSEYRVHYLHRTAREFVESPKMWKLIQERTSGTNFNPNVSLLRSCLYNVVISSGTKGSPVSQWPARNALIYAYHANRENSIAYIPLIDELDNHMAISMVASTEPTRHWANKISDMTSHSSVLTLAIQCDLSLYVTHKLRERGGIGAPKNDPPLLEYVVTKDSITQRLPFSPNAAKVLLDHGADPNQKYNEYSVWEKAVYALNKHWKSPVIIDGFGNGRTNEEVRSTVAFLDTFLRHGASPKAYIIIGNYEKQSLSALEVVKKTLGGSCPSESKSLVGDLVGNFKKCGAKSHIRRRQIPITIFQKEMHLFWLDP